MFLGVVRPIQRLTHMKRSEINRAYRRALDSFRRHHWVLPPDPRWDVTDFGLGQFDALGLTLINLANEPEYCEKLMYAWRAQRTPCHAHARKKEDIICRTGTLAMWLWARKPEAELAVAGEPVTVAVNGVATTLGSGEALTLPAGHRVTLVPGVWHAFAPMSEECIIGEVSTANDDLTDNFFLTPDMGRFPRIEEDEPALVKLLSE